MFAEGIAGRFVHIKSLAECPPQAAGVGDPDAGPGDGINARHDGRAVYLAERIDHLADDGLNAALYRLAALDELGFREFGTYRFTIETARRRLPWLAARRDNAVFLRESDLGVFFEAFARPRIARRLFRVIETARVRGAVSRRYPGTRRYRRLLAGCLAERRAGTGAALTDLDALRLALLGLDVESRLLPFAAEVLLPAADVYTSAAATFACYEMLDLDAGWADDDAGQHVDETTMEWLQREARLDDWDGELADKDAEIAAMEFAEVASATETTVANASGLDGEVREVDAALVAERDQLKRRLDMERSSVRRALGDGHDTGASFSYDEWDYHNRTYLRGACRLYEERLNAKEDADTQALIDAVRPHVRAARRQFEQVRPTGYQRVRKTPDGDELDLDAIVETRADIRTGASPDEGVYSRRERLRRDVGAALLVDLSASTDDVIPEEQETPEPARPAQDIRDPYFDEDEDYDFAARMAAQAAKRRIIDILRESVLLLGTALESLGDRYAVYGFSGYGRDCVEFFVAKEFDDPLDDQALDAIAAMKPKRSTRMGPAIRHACTKLDSSGAALKVLMIVSDGFPQDHDYGPDRGEHEYGVQDTARALVEAEARGIETFCVTVDRSGHDYLRRMCPEDRYLVIEETAELPTALQKTYRQLTRV
ncbi:MAG: VWA domain-containing protein [Gammaproteobacteria bacterium]|nr:VWA domain-containing protein [Gammaproteobacteria bacterium]